MRNSDSNFDEKPYHQYGQSIDRYWDRQCGHIVGVFSKRFHEIMIKRLVDSLAPSQHVRTPQALVAMIFRASILEEAIRTSNELQTINLMSTDSSSFVPKFVQEIKA
jgi:hypothetical protein